MGYAKPRGEGGEILRASEDLADRDRRDNLMEELEMGLSIRGRRVAFSEGHEKLPCIASFECMNPLLSDKSS